jgi:hypothetical protein
MPDPVGMIFYFTNIVKNKNVWNRTYLVLNLNNWLYNPAGLLAAGYDIKMCNWYKKTFHKTKSQCGVLGCSPFLPQFLLGTKYKPQESQI